KRLLPPKTLAVQAVGTQVKPQAVFRIGHGLAEVFGEFCLVHWPSLAIAPSPHPLSLRGRGAKPASHLRSNLPSPLGGEGAKPASLVRSTHTAPPEGEGLGERGTRLKSGGPQGQHPYLQVWH